MIPEHDEVDFLLDALVLPELVFASRAAVKGTTVKAALGAVARSSERVFCLEDVGFARPLATQCLDVCVETGLLMTHIGDAPYAWVDVYWDAIRQRVRQHTSDAEFRFGRAVGDAELTTRSDLTALFDLAVSGGVAVPSDFRGFVALASHVVHTGRDAHFFEWLLSGRLPNKFCGDSRDWRSRPRAADWARVDSVLQN